MASAGLTEDEKMAEVDDSYGEITFPKLTQGSGGARESNLEDDRGRSEATRRSRSPSWDHEGHDCPKEKHPTWDDAANLVPTQEDPLPPWREPGIAPFRNDYMNEQYYPTHSGARDRGPGRLSRTSNRPPPGRDDWADWRYQSYGDYGYWLPQPWWAWSGRAYPPAWMSDRPVEGSARDRQNQGRPREGQPRAMQSRSSTACYTERKLPPYLIPPTSPRSERGSGRRDERGRSPRDRHHQSDSRPPRPSSHNREVNQEGYRHVTNEGVYERTAVANRTDRPYGDRGQATHSRDMDRNSSRPPPRATFKPRTYDGSYPWEEYKNYILRLARLNGEPQGQLARWLERLATLEFSIEHRPGKYHTNADTLSRRPCPFPCAQCGKEHEEPAVRKRRPPPPKTKDGRRKVSEEGPAELGAGHSRPLGRSGESQDDRHPPSSEADDKPSEVSSEEGRPVTYLRAASTRRSVGRRGRGRQLRKQLNQQRGEVDTSSQTWEDDNLLEAQERDMVLQVVRAWGDQRPTWDEIAGEAPDVKYWWDQYDCLFRNQKDLLCYRWTEGDDAIEKVILPTDLIPTLLALLHDHPSAGHMG